MNLWSGFSALPKMRRRRGKMENARIRRALAWSDNPLIYQNLQNVFAQPVFHFYQRLLLRHTKPTQNWLLYVLAQKWENVKLFLWVDHSAGIKRPTKAKWMRKCNAQRISRALYQLAQLMPFRVFITDSLWTPYFFALIRILRAFACCFYANLIRYNKLRKLKKAKKQTRLAGLW